jgi:hypothetical protein
LIYYRAKILSKLTYSGVRWRGKAERKVSER